MQLVIIGCCAVTCDLFGELILNASVYYIVYIAAIIMSKHLHKL